MRCVRVTTALIVSRERVDVVVMLCCEKDTFGDEVWSVLSRAKERRDILREVPCVPCGQEQPLIRTTFSLLATVNGNTSIQWVSVVWRKVQTVTDDHEKQRHFVEGFK